MTWASSQRAGGLSAAVVVLAFLLQGCGSTGGADSVDSDETDSPVFAYEPGLLSVAADGVMVAVIDESGDLALPFVTPFRAESLLADVPTLEQLRIAAQAPETVVDLDALGRPVASG